MFYYVDLRHLFCDTCISIRATQSKKFQKLMFTGDRSINGWSVRAITSILVFELSFVGVGQVSTHHSRQVILIHEAQGILSINQETKPLDC
jgi:hypothetical protein